MTRDVSQCVALNKSVGHANGTMNEAAHDFVARNTNTNVPAGVVGRPPRENPGVFKRDETSKQTIRVSCTRTGWMSARYTRARARHEGTR
jgi:hypothetical protein